MEMSSYTVWIYLTLTAAIFIDGLPVQPNEYGQVNCWGWRGATIKLCSDEAGRAFILTQDSRGSSGSPISQGHVQTEFPGSHTDSEGHRQLSDLNLMQNLPGQNHHSRSQSSPNKNGKLPIILKRPFDSITYNHDLAGFK